MEIPVSAMVGAILTILGWLLHESRRLRDLIAECQRDIIAIRVILEHALKEEHDNNEKADEQVIEIVPINRARRD
jgi:hypothetical protein